MIDLPRGNFLTSVVAATIASLVPVSRQIQIRKQVIPVTFDGAQQFDGPPSITEVAASNQVGWANARFASRIFRITSSLTVEHFDFRDEGWAVNLVPFEDGSVCFRQALLEGGPAAEIQDVLRLSATGALLGKIRSPEGVRIDKIGRLGTDTLIGCSEDYNNLFVAQKGAFAPLNMRATETSDSVATGAIVDLRRASDGAIWYLRGSPPSVIGRLDPNRTFTESSITLKARPCSIASFTPIGERSMLLFLTDVNGQSLSELCVVKRDFGKLNFTFHTYGGAPLCVGNTDHEGRFWFVDLGNTALYVATLFPFKRLTFTSLGTTLLVGGDSTLFSAFRSGMLIPGFSSIDYYTL